MATTTGTEKESESPSAEGKENKDTFAIRYKVLGGIGEGSYSKVLKCRNRESGTVYACKRLKHCYRNWAQVNEISEITTLRRLPNHPNILQMIEIHFDPEVGHVSLVFELMDMNLYELIKDRKRLLPESRVRLMIFQLIRGLRHLHKQGIFHRDVKPENILLKRCEGQQEDILKIGDLGSVRGLTHRPPYTEYISTRWYRSPECLLTSGFYGIKMDIWAVGCVFYEILTLRPLFPGANELDQIHKIHKLMGPPPQKCLEDFAKHAAERRHFMKVKKQKRADTIHQTIYELENGVGKYGNFDWYFTGTKQLNPFDKLLPNHVTKNGRDLLTELLQYDPEERPTAHRALFHPYFDNLRDAAKKALNGPNEAKSQTSLVTLTSSKPVIPNNNTNLPSIDAGGVGAGVDIRIIDNKQTTMNASTEISTRVWNNTKIMETRIPNPAPPPPKPNSNSQKIPTPGPRIAIPILHQRPQLTTVGLETATSNVTQKIETLRQRFEGEIRTGGVGKTQSKSSTLNNSTSKIPKPKLNRDYMSTYMKPVIPRLIVAAAATTTTSLPIIGDGAGGTRNIQIQKKKSSSSNTENKLSMASLNKTSSKASGTEVVHKNSLSPAALQRINANRLLVQLEPIGTNPTGTEIRNAIANKSISKIPQPQSISSSSPSPRTLSNSKLSFTLKPNGTYINALSSSVRGLELKSTGTGSAHKTEFKPNSSATSLRKPPSLWKTMQPHGHGNGPPGFKPLVHPQPIIPSPPGAIQVQPSQKPSIQSLENFLKIRKLEQQKQHNTQKQINLPISLGNAYKESPQKQVKAPAAAPVQNLTKLYYQPKQVLNLVDVQHQQSQQKHERPILLLKTKSQIPQVLGNHSNVLQERKKNFKLSKANERTDLTRPPEHHAHLLHKNDKEMKQEVKNPEILNRIGTNQPELQSLSLGALNQSRNLISKYGSLNSKLKPLGGSNQFHDDAVYVSSDDEAIMNIRRRYDKLINQRAFVRQSELLATRPSSRYHQSHHRFPAQPLRRQHIQQQSKYDDDDSTNNNISTADLS